MREIVTIQVGGFSNYIGSHFWNFQDELLGLAEELNGDNIYKNPGFNYDVLYRCGETQQGNPTCTPRLLSIDLPGSLGSLPSRGSLYGDTSTEISTWTGKIEKVVSEHRERNLFLQSLDEEHGSSMNDENNQTAQDKARVECLQDGVQFWTDFSKVHYHPKSLYELTGLWSHSHDFDNYGSGIDIFSRSPSGDEISERLRFFVEECDHIQGLQFIVDDSGGFASLAADFLESVADEYSNIPVLLYAARSPADSLNIQNQQNRMLRALHNSVSFSRLSSFCKLMVPIGLPSFSTSLVSNYLCVKDLLPFYSSAVYSAALHSISLPLRMSKIGPANFSDAVSGAFDFSSFTQMLVDHGRQNRICILDIAMPAPPLPGDPEQSFVHSCLHSLTPDVREYTADSRSVECTVIQGALDSGGSRASITEVGTAFYKDLQLIESAPVLSHLSAALCPLPIPLPFPSIFKDVVGHNGELIGMPNLSSQIRGSLDVFSIPLATRMRSSSSVLPFIVKKLEGLRRFGLMRGAAGAEVLRRWNFQKDELEDMSESMSRMVKLLDGGDEGSSDSE